MFQVQLNGTNISEELPSRVERDGVNYSASPESLLDVAGAGIPDLDRLTNPRESETPRKDDRKSSERVFLLSPYPSTVDFLYVDCNCGRACARLTEYNGRCTPKPTHGYFSRK